uniref:2,3-bisphosphoglycerate-independent phosphoglycerate mutase n=1 Tax=Synarthrophyton chejuense TaxID=2485825 RepID=A0A3G3MFL9_9FLOR|nr:phosphoglycerate mutase [Synarthrophyton chejuense]AYR05623.1 phosphoglycerate mutase [Synarthrophyton chejuense]
MKNKKKLNSVILLILDGWGHSNIYHGNAIQQAYKPNLKFLWDNFPKTLLKASSYYVGLPNNQMGNSEVGHTTIGAGRVINQDLVRISQSIINKNFFKNNLIKKIYERTNENNKQIHLIGLCSDGGVHSHINHLIALLEISKTYKKLKTCIHIITDGRDTEQKKAIYFINQIIHKIQKHPNIKICTISGRYYSMDRDCRWTRTEKIYRCLTENTIIDNNYNNSIKIIEKSYQQNIFDEFIIPTRINKRIINDNDSIIFFNFRPDRIKQLVQAFTSNSFKGFPTKKFKSLNISTFTNYDSKLNLPVIFPKLSKNNFLGKVISDKGFKQFRLAETEKYAHVTYFFNGGQEEPYSGEDRELVPSPNVDFYDLSPNMSVKQITEKLITKIKKNIYQFIVVNYANADMIGHTGNFKATKSSIEQVDQCIGSILETIQDSKSTLIITADHGNAEEMLNIENEPRKSHTNNLVPFILIGNKSNNLILNTKKKIGSLADIAPTILDLLNIEIPNDMNGISLIKRKK